MNGKKANRYIALIKQMFTGKVSEKLFLNAKNKDLYGINDELPITFAEIDQKLLKSYFGGLKECLNNSYIEAKKAAAPMHLKRTLAKNVKEDLKTLSEMQEGLSKTMERYNYENDLKNLLNTDK